MFNESERVISFSANGISVGTFIAAILGYLDVDILPTIKATKESTFILAVGAISLIISYSTANIIEKNRLNGKSIGHLIVIFCFGYILSTAFVINWLSGNAQFYEAKSETMNSAITSGIIYAAMHIATFLHKIVYPNGFSFWAYTTTFFRGGFYIMLFVLILYFGSMSFLYPALLSGIE